MSSPILIQPYNSKSAEAYKELNLQWIKKYFTVEQKDLDQLNNPQECIDNGGMIFCALHGESVVGVCAIYKVESGVYEIAKMAVHPSARGQGLGSRLMEACESWALEQGGVESFMLSNTILKPAIALYKKHGYKIFHEGQHPSYDRSNIGLRKTLGVP